MKLDRTDAALLRRLMDYPHGLDARQAEPVRERIAALRAQGLVAGELVLTVTDLGVRHWVASVLEDAGTPIPPGLLPGS